VLAPVFGLIAVCIRPLPGGARRERSERLGMRERRLEGAASRAADHRKAAERASGEAASRAADHLEAGSRAL
jgi:hypothetical protein